MNNPYMRGHVRVPAVEFALDAGRLLLRKQIGRPHDSIVEIQPHVKVEFWWPSQMHHYSSILKTPDLGCCCSLQSSDNGFPYQCLSCARGPTLRRNANGFAVRTFWK